MFIHIKGSFLKFEKEPVKWLSSAKADNQSLIPGVHVVERNRTESYKLSLNREVERGREEERIFFLI